MTFERYYQDEFEDEVKIYEKRAEIRRNKKGDKKVIKIEVLKKQKNELK